MHCLTLPVCLMSVICMCLIICKSWWHHLLWQKLVEIKFKILYGVCFLDCYLTPRLFRLLVLLLWHCEATKIAWMPVCVFFISKFVICCVCNVCLPVPYIWTNSCRWWEVSRHCWLVSRQYFHCFGLGLDSSRHWQLKRCIT